MEISVEYNSDFRYDLKEGKLKGEKKFHKMLSDSTIEVKYDRQTRKTKNVYIEFESRGKTSGIRTTEAEYWTYFIQDEMCLTIPTQRLKEKIIKLKPRKVPGGDKDSSKGFLISVNDLIGV